MPKLTNKFNLPEVLVRAIAQDPYEFSGDISVTQAIKSPRQRWLEIRHDLETEEDVVDCIYRLFGSGIHAIMEQASDSNSSDIQEERLEASLGGWVISGATDIYEADTGRLLDFKVTSVYAGISGLKSDWRWQTNMLAYLYRKAGFKVTSLGILCIYRDFSKYRMMASKNYPRRQSEVLEVDLMPNDEIEAYMLERIKLHKESEHLPDDKLPMCTNEECWYKGTTYAIMKNKNKRAQRVLNSIAEAESYLSWIQEEKPKDKFKIVVREGEYTRCENFCVVKPFCSQYKDRNNKNTESSV